MLRLEKDPFGGLFAKFFPPKKKIENENWKRENGKWPKDSRRMDDIFAIYR